MKHFFSLLFLVALANTAIWAQPAEAADAYTPTVEENSLLWQSSSAGLETPSYLFGTIHMIGKKDFFLTETMKASFAKTQRVAFEIDMEDMSDFSTIMPLMMKTFMANGTTLQDLVTEEEYKMVKEHFQEMGLPMMLLDRIKPMFLSAMTSGDMFNTENTPDAMISYEMELMKMAQEQEKEIDGL